MSASYWRTAGMSVATGLGEKAIRRLGIGGKILGRAGSVVGIGLLLYELFSNYKDNIAKEPAYREMMALQRERDKWTSAISCLGREPFEAKEYGSLDGGGAINALYRKKGLGSLSIRAADPKQAHALMGRAIDYIMRLDDLSVDSRFSEERRALIAQLATLRDQLHGNGDYDRIQSELARIADEMRFIESSYALQIHDRSRELQKTLGSNAAWAVASMATLGIVRKP